MITQARRHCLRSRRRRGIPRKRNALSRSASTTRRTATGWRRIALVVLSAAGCGISLVLLGMSVPGGSGAGAMGSALCAPGDRVNCDYVLGSRYGRVGPIPAALVGVGYFSTLVVWFAAVGLPNRRGRYWHAVPLALGCVGMAASAWFTYVMAARLPVWCTWCVAAHVANAGIFLLTLLTWPRRGDPTAAQAAAGVDARLDEAYPSFTRGLGVLGGCGAAGVVILTTGLWVTSAAYAARLEHDYLAVTNDVAYVIWKFDTAGAHEIPIRPDDPSEGPADAPNTLVVFADYECPHCYQVHRMAHDLATRQFAGRLRYVAKHFPVCAACNPHVSATLHYFACEAALAAEAARIAGTAEQAAAYRRLLYQNAARLDERPYAELAMAVGLDRGAFERALAGEDCRRRVREDVDLGQRLGVEGTPALFLNGRRLAHWRIVREDKHRETDFERTLELWRRLLRVPGESR